MKNILLVIGIALGLFASQASAYTLVVDGQTLTNVTVSDFGFSGGVLTLNTGGTLIVDGDPGNGSEDEDGEDTTPPTLVITASPSTLTGTQTSTLTFSFSETVTGFTASDVSVSGGALSGFSGSGSSYSGILTPSGASTISVSVAAGAYQDLAGNTNTGSSSINLTYSEGAAGQCGSGVVCAYNITTWPAESSKAITVPKGSILASKFTTTSSGTVHGRVYFEAAAWTGYPATDIWISTTPGGEALPQSRCSKRQSYIYNLAWSQFDHGTTCNLQPNTTYYFNMQHVDPAQGASTVYRYIK